MRTPSRPTPGRSPRWAPRWRSSGRSAWPARSPRTSAAYGDAMASGLIAARGWGRFLGANPPLHILVSTWPLVLGLALRRTRWRELVRAGALTFLVLSVGGLLSALADWSHGPGRWIAIGSFRMPKTGWSRLSAGAMAMGVAGAAQLLLELATAVCALSLAFRRDGDGLPADRPAAARRSRFSRLALSVSVAFLVLTIRLPAWSTVLELVNQSQWVREFILRDDLARLRTTRKIAAARIGVGGPGARAAQRGRAGVASGPLRHVLGPLLAPRGPAEHDPDVDHERRGAPARRAGPQQLGLAAGDLPGDGLAEPRGRRQATPVGRSSWSRTTATTWNTLGVAYFRLGAWDDAPSALYRSMELRDEGDSIDWFFLAMIHQRLGRKERAREWYDKAVQWTHALGRDDRRALSIRGRGRRGRWACPGPTGRLRRRSGGWAPDPSVRPRSPGGEAGWARPAPPSTRRTRPAPPETPGGDGGRSCRRRPHHGIGPASRRMSRPDPAVSAIPVRVDGPGVSEHTPPARELPLAHGMGSDPRPQPAQRTASGRCPRGPGGTGPTRTDRDVMRQAATIYRGGPRPGPGRAGAGRRTRRPRASRRSARARQLIQAGDRATALSLLEDALIDGPAGDRPAVLDLLRQSYEVDGPRGRGRRPHRRRGPLPR